jgi:hypothetical protein
MLQIKVTPVSSKMQMGLGRLLGAGSDEERGNAFQATEKCDGIDGVVLVL